MNRPDDRNAAIDACACHWVARLQADDCTAAERNRFEDWLAEDPRHVQAWVAADTLHARSAALADDAWVRTAAARAAARPPVRRRWPALATAAAMCLAVGVGALIHAERNPTLVTYGNTSARVQQQELADGTVATLDAGTQVQARFGWRTRELTLQRGRLQLVVAPSLRPLQVTAGATRIRDIGTTFQVERLGDGQVHVGLLEGAVEVRSDHGLRTLAPGQQVQVQPSGQLLPAAPLATEAATAWTAGTLLFDATPLPVVVERVNRYSDTAWVVADPAIAGVQVSGRFAAGDTRELLEALRVGWSITAHPRRDGALELRGAH